ncbi:MAG: phosphoenolpyruvate carboxykinase (GTP) [Deltaproteobacteria bacterium]|nr:phosphoenolpyruvate carboxykinase (GTP) [Deltaproteobacteria bacterium]MBW1993424.1 phosphoenolpyruvate carboxykinase (GTP) [Deltaproteobacteria bacterium]
MSNDDLKLLKDKLAEQEYQRLAALNNTRLFRFVADAVALCEPGSVVVQDDSPEAMEMTRKKAVETGEETPLAISDHTVHFDGMEDQGRDREVTRYLVPKDDTLPEALNQIEREEGLAEIRGLLKGSMRGRTMIVRFLSLGPTNSVFSIPCVECTDSWYVSHSLNLLYRRGYEEFKRLGESAEFFATLHSSGKLTERMVSAEPDKKRIYIDYTTDTVYSVNTQYAGNTVGLKKLALRLTIRKADREGWLAEHMFLAGIHGPGGRKTYMGGAFPSACGKTSTAMLPGEMILGDDIAYFRAINGEFRAANAESGIFGIIQNVNANDDPTIWDVLHKPVEVIFSNVLIKDGKPYWLGMGCKIPETGENFSGQWYKGKKDEAGNEIPPAHKNARYAVALSALENCDPELDNPNGVVLGGIMYGGRDRKSYVPVQQGFDWDHGIVAYGASLETETTFAIVGKEGVPEINLMSIQDFVAIPLGKYIKNNLDFGKKVDKPPLVFGVNYFLCDAEGKFVNAINDKHVWVKWMELRIHNEVGAIRAPTGWIPRYEDLKPLFKQVLDKEYSHEDYVKQFTIRVPENLAKLDRVEAFHRENVSDAPPELFEILAAQRERLLRVQQRCGDYVAPEDLPQDV